MVDVFSVGPDGTVRCIYVVFPPQNPGQSPGLKSGQKPDQNSGQKFVRQIDRKLSEKLVKHLKKISPKLLPKKTKLQMNQSEFLAMLDPLTFLFSWPWAQIVQTHDLKVCDVHDGPYRAVL